MAQLTETRWTRYGKDRIYLRTADGEDVGHVDLVEGRVVLKVADFATELHECLVRWTGLQDAAAPDTARPEPLTDPAFTALAAETQTNAMEDDAPTAIVEQGRDLATNVAGAAARAKRNEVNSQAPVLNFVARVLGVKTDERAWRIGAKGEEKVANELAELGDAWFVLHAVEVGGRGCDIDHIVIGPPGVITLNAKRQPRGKAWVGEQMVMVNGQKTDYLRNSRFEAQRAARLLSAACNRIVPVAAAIVFVDLDGFTEKKMPADVHVTTRTRLLGWLRALPKLIDNTAVEEIHSKARLSETWT